MQEKRCDTHLNILAFDTAYNWVSAILKTKTDVFFLEKKDREQNSQTILPCISQLMDLAQISFSDLDAIGVGVGPGRFTGVRVAVCAAQGLGFSQKIPILPLSSLQALAAEHHSHSSFEIPSPIDLVPHQEKFKFNKIWVLMQAKIDFFYCGVFSGQDLSPQLFSEKLCKVSDCKILARDMDPENDLIVGDDLNFLNQVRGWIGKEISIIEKKAPSPHALIKLAANAFFQKKWILPHEIKPNYLSEWAAQ